MSSQRHMMPYHDAFELELFLDVNECTQGLLTCANNGTCVNTDGSAHCDCPDGWLDNCAIGQYRTIA